MLTTSFVVSHKDQKISESLGLGFVVGELSEKETLAYQVKVEIDGQEINAIKTVESIKTSYKVLWTKNRSVSPSIHQPDELEWEMLTEEFLMEDDETEDDETEEYTDETQESNDVEVVGQDNSNLQIS